MGNRAAAERFFEQAMQAVADKANPQHLQIAYQLFGSAVLADPTWENAHYQLGNNNSDLKCALAAIANYRQSLECETTDENRAKVLVNLGWQLHYIGRDKEAVKITEEALKIDDKLVLGWHNLSLINGRFGNDYNSIVYARKAYALDPNDIHTPIGLAFALLFAGNYQEGFRHFEKRFEWRLHHFLHYPYPKWEGEAGKTVFLVADQGLGDTLSFSRFVPAAAERASFIHLIVQPELIRAFNYALAGYTNINIMPMGTQFLQADAWSTFVSLPFALGLTDQQVREQPALSFPRFQGPHPQGWKVTDRKIHIGVAWAGSPLNDIDEDRNFPVTDLLELYRCPGVQLYNFQVGDRGKEAREKGAGSLIVDLTGYIRDICDTWSLLPQLDLVVCCESALGHICGAVDFPCWIPYSYKGRDYRAGHTGEKPLWYKRHKFFRQGPDMQWRPVFDRIVEQLKRRFK